MRKYHTILRVALLCLMVPLYGSIHASKCDITDACTNWAASNCPNNEHACSVDGHCQCRGSNKCLNGGNKCTNNSQCPQTDHYNNVCEAGCCTVTQ